MEINDLESIIKILKQNDVEEFELTQGETHIKLSRTKLSTPTYQMIPQVAPVMPMTPMPMAAAPQTSGEINATPALSDNMIAVESPMVGTFYRRPSPDAEPYVKEGDVVSKGKILCIVEAMKVMNEIEATCDGKIVKVMLSDGQVVEYGETLFLIEPL